MAVYTHLSDTQLRDMVEREYVIGSFISAAGIASGVSNSNYHLVTSQGSYILTLYEHRTDPADLPFFLGLMQHLAAQGIACPQPLPRRDGALYGTVGGKAAAIVSFLEGGSVETPAITTGHTAAVGQALAALHRAADGFAPTRGNSLGMEGWNRLYHALEGRLDSITPGLETLVADELSHLHAHWPSALAPRGVIHADFFPDNVFFEGGRLSGIIDFYFACNDLLAYDVAIAVNAWCFARDGAFFADKADALLAAYHAVRPLGEAEIAALPLLLRGAAMRFLMTRCYDWVNHDPTALVTPHDPLDYVRRLHFHQRAGWAIAGV